MKIEFKELPYAADALEPHYKAETVHLHYEKHHRGYFDKVVEAIKGTKFEDMTLEDIIRVTAKNPQQIVLFQNAAQVWNHDFFWRSMKPQGGGAPTGELKTLVERSFKGADELQQKLHETAVKQFGSGWAWLTLNRDKLAIVSTSNADTPLTSSATPLLAIDVWEHAYYLDYKNKRPDYVDAFLSHLVNWDHAAAMLTATVSEPQPPIQFRSAARGD
jgi:Fe-Mn family superoxide dismutase